MATWTVDVDGGDYGGRSNSMLGTVKGVQAILKLFEFYKVKAIFFISTEILDTGFIEGYTWLVKDIMNAGHEVGSHGHFHIKYNTDDRKLKDKHISQIALAKVTGNLYPHYRAPKFSYMTEDIYSNPKNHVSLLRHMWFRTPINPETIIYLHPFDIVGGQNAPNLFCALWYSNPRMAYHTLVKLLKETRDSSN